MVLSLVYKHSQVKSHGVLLQTHITAKGVDQLQSGLVEPASSLLAVFFNGGLCCGTRRHAGCVVSCLSLGVGRLGYSFRSAAIGGGGRGRRRGGGGIRFS